MLFAGVPLKTASHLAFRAEHRLRIFRVGTRGEAYCVNDFRDGRLFSGFCASLAPKISQS